jgi:phosphoribosylformylglycinamidine synthase subunit PurL
MAQALVESCVRGGRGIQIALPFGTDPFVWLFSESAARAVAAVDPADEARFVAMCQERGSPVTRLGVVGGASFDVAGLFSVSLAELGAAWSSTLPAVFD